MCSRRINPAAQFHAQLHVIHRSRQTRRGTGPHAMALLGHDPRATWLRLWGERRHGRWGW
ncbi:MAG: hypothetical protein HC911_17840 [Chloroflexaceae bacterium]|nr:hypothetical protein [Chloroflexaceae bacterium]